MPSFPHGPRQDVKPIEITQPDGPELHRRRPRRALAEVAPADRLHRPRRASCCTRSATTTATACGRSSTAPRCPRCSCPTATRPPTHSARTSSTRASTASGCSPTPWSSAATAWARSATSTASSTTRTARPMVVPNAICMHEEDTRHRLEAHRLPHRLRRGPADAPDGHLLDRHRRQLRVRLLLVPLPRRHDRVRGQAHRRHLHRRRPARATARPRHARRARPVRPAPPALLQRAAGHGRRRPGQPGLRGRLRRRCPKARATRSGNAWRDQGGPDLQTRRPAPAAPIPSAGRYWKIVNEPGPERPRSPARLQAGARAHVAPICHPGSAVARRARLHHQPAVGDRVRPRRDVRHRRLPQPVRRRRRPARVRPGGPTAGRHRRGALVHVRHPPRGAPGGLAGDAGAPDRFPAHPVPGSSTATRPWTTRLPSPLPASGELQH